MYVCISCCMCVCATYISDVKRARASERASERERERATERQRDRERQRERLCLSTRVCAKNKLTTCVAGLIHVCDMMC